MAFPQAGDFTRANEPMLNAGRAEEIDISRQLRLGGKKPVGQAWRMFHVKRRDLADANNDPASGLLAGRLTDQARGGDSVVHDLALERGHGIKGNRGRRALGFGDSLLGELLKGGATSSTVTGDVKHQA